MLGKMESYTGCMLNAMVLITVWLPLATAVEAKVDVVDEARDFEMELEINPMKLRLNKNKPDWVQLLESGAPIRTDLSFVDGEKQVVN
ncbi:hypothetical protein NPIL_32891 [Nephila pilipes]|uniref:Uncharacterized protein n=1 Tax=Nephila pilipes TaxID=299642 RepID=A0A8X6TCM1_NEPPI|nr:hypothetical protein NPIL_32891 [Nephila pilipes]